MDTNSDRAARRKRRNAPSVSAIVGVLVAPYLLAMEGRTEGVTEVIR